MLLFYILLLLVLVTEFYYNAEDDLQTSDFPVSTSQMLIGGMHCDYEILAVKPRDSAILANMSCILNTCKNS